MEDLPSLQRLSSPCWKSIAVYPTSSFGNGTLTRGWRLEGCTHNFLISCFYRTDFNPFSTLGIWSFQHGILRLFSNFKPFEASARARHILPFLASESIAILTRIGYLTSTCVGGSTPMNYFEPVYTFTLVSKLCFEWGHGQDLRLWKNNRHYSIT